MELIAHIFNCIPIDFNCIPIDQRVLIIDDSDLSTIMCLFWITARLRDIPKFYGIRAHADSDPVRRVLIASGSTGPARFS
jgi:hypothetical protein